MAEDHIAEDRMAEDHMAEVVERVPFPLRAVEDMYIMKIADRITYIRMQI